MKNTLLFCNGVSGSGKTCFIKEYLPQDLFYGLRSATTRPMRKQESEGNPYFFRDEAYFENAQLATRLWVNEKIWQPGMPKWLYGIPESEIYENLGKNLVYDVIEPRYSRQLIDWFNQNGLAKHYEFKIAYFLPYDNQEAVISKRANMPNDAIVRKDNTCNPIDFLNAGLDIDYILQPINNKYNPRLIEHIRQLQSGFQR